MFINNLPYGIIILYRGLVFTPTAIDCFREALTTILIIVDEFANAFDVPSITRLH